MTDNPTFSRTIENFVCEQCGETVVGDGFTNHCPHCLWSKHVDVNPGDRAAPCKGSMQPVSVLREHQRYVITHRCTRCGFERRQKSNDQDSFEALLAIVRGIR